ncbi:MAG: YggS family pyridoxal phosphate-dependent enzyme, partial [Bacteroidota bacterium]
MDIQSNIKQFQNHLQSSNCRLVAVSKTKPNEDILEAYASGQRIFGENKVQELATKSEQLPKDIQWHMIGHLQRNKVKYIAPFVDLIHSIDSLRLLNEVEKQGKKTGRTIHCLLQVFIADEETKFGLDGSEVLELINNPVLAGMKHVKIVGLMGMATFTGDKDKIRNEFKELKSIFDKVAASDLPANIEMTELSMGMSGDYQIAIEEGSTLIRVGSSIFG